MNALTQFTAIVLIPSDHEYHKVAELSFNVNHTYESRQDWLRNPTDQRNISTENTEFKGFCGIDVRKRHDREWQVLVRRKQAQDCLNILNWREESREYEKLKHWLARNSIGSSNRVIFEKMKKRMYSYWTRARKHRKKTNSARRQAVEILS